MTVGVPVTFVVNSPCSTSGAPRPCRPIPHAVAHAGRSTAVASTLPGAGATLAVAVPATRCALGLAPAPGLVVPATHPPLLVVTERQPLALTGSTIRHRHPPIVAVGVQDAADDRRGRQTNPVTSSRVVNTAPSTRATWPTVVDAARANHPCEPGSGAELADSQVQSRAGGRGRPGHSYRHDPPAGSESPD